MDAEGHGYPTPFPFIRCVESVKLLDVSSKPQNTTTCNVAHNGVQKLQELQI